MEKLIKKGGVFHSILAFYLPLMMWAPNITFFSTYNACAFT